MCGALPSCVLTCFAHFAPSITPWPRKPSLPPLSPSVLYLPSLALSLSPVSSGFWPAGWSEPLRCIRLATYLHVSRQMRIMPLPARAACRVRTNERRGDVRKEGRKGERQYQLHDVLRVNKQASHDTRREKVRKEGSNQAKERGGRGSRNPISNHREGRMKGRRERKRGFE